jgi:hypothetical protein
MVIKIASKFVTFDYIVDESAVRKKKFSLIFTIKLNIFNHTIDQPLVHVARMLDWVKLKNLPHWRGQKLTMVGIFCVCGCGCVSILVPSLKTIGREFSFSAFWSSSNA